MPPAETPYDPELPKLLAVLRSCRGLTQGTLARSTGIAPGSLSEYESGKVTPRLSTLQRILRGLRVSFSALDSTRSFVDSLDENVSEEKPRQAGAALRPPDPRDREEVPALLARLDGYGLEVQEALIQETREFDSWALAESWCLASTAMAPSDPVRAVARASLAALLARKPLLPEPYLARLRAYVAVHLGNANRVAGDLPEARAAFGRAEEHRLESGDRPPFLMEEERIEALRASYLVARGDLAEARATLRRLLASPASATLRATHFLNLARAYEGEGLLAEAIEVLKEARPEVDAAADLRLSYCHRQNLLWLFAGLGRVDEARALLPEATRLVQAAGGELDFVRLDWAKARIAFAAGEDEKGIRLLSGVRGAFASRGIAYDAALATLELAVAHLRAGRTAPVRDLARHLAPIFQSQGLHAHALAALAVFRQAAERDAVTIDLATRLVHYLERARFRPDLAFAG